MSSLEPFLAQLEPTWAGGSHNGVAFWRPMKTKSFTGGLRVATGWKPHISQNWATLTEPWSNG
jgi:hypothetical protein